MDVPRDEDHSPDHAPRTHPKAVERSVLAHKSLLVSSYQLLEERPPFTGRNIRVEPSSQSAFQRKAFAQTNRAHTTRRTQIPSASTALLPSMSASTAATPAPVPAPAALASSAPPSKPPTPAGGTLTPIAVAPPTSGGARVYNAIYSSVQVYECMVRGIAVMRRRVDSYVNATQILKVAGIDKGRRTKILEKEILPGRHEIVQGGYGKYQGTW